MAALPRQVAHAKKESPAFAELLADVDGTAVTSRAVLATLPVVRKKELLERQKAQRATDPFGGFSAVRWGPRMRRVYAIPGPIYEPEASTRDYWRTARALFVAGFRSGDLVYNSFSCHMTPGAFMYESGALELGCTMFPAGTGQTEQQLQASMSSDRRLTSERLASSESWPRRQLTPAWMYRACGWPRWPVRLAHPARRSLWRSRTPCAGRKRVINHVSRV